MKLHRRQLPCPKAHFLSALETYTAAMLAHAATEGTPAPFPEFEILRSILESGEPLEIEQEVISAASYPTENTDIVTVQVEGGASLPASRGDGYMWDVLQDWAASGGVIQAYQPPTAQDLARQKLIELDDLLKLRGIREGLLGLFEWMDYLRSTPAIDLTDPAIVAALAANPGLAKIVSQMKAVSDYIRALPPAGTGAVKLKQVDDQCAQLRQIFAPK